MVLPIGLSICIIEKNLKSFSIFGNSGKIWVSVLHFRRFAEVDSTFGRNEAVPALGRGRSQHIWATVRTIRSILGSPVWL